MAFSIRTAPFVFQTLVYVGTCAARQLETFVALAQICPWQIGALAVTTKSGIPALVDVLALVVFQDEPHVTLTFKRAGQIDAQLVALAVVGCALVDV